MTNTEKYILSHRLYYDNCVTASRYSSARLQERPGKGVWNDVSITRKWKADGYLVMGLFYVKKTLHLNTEANTIGYVDTNTCQLNTGLFSSCRSKTILDSCPYLSILALSWYPQQINGHTFEGKDGDYIQIPERLLDVPDAEVLDGKRVCTSVQFVEYSSQQWFLAGNNLPALKDKVISHLKLCDRLSFPFTRQTQNTLA